MLLACAFAKPNVLNVCTGTFQQRALTFCKYDQCGLL